MGDFTLSDVLDKPWSYVSSLLLPVLLLKYVTPIRRTEKK